MSGTPRGLLPGLLPGLWLAVAALALPAAAQTPPNPTPPPASAAPVVPATPAAPGAAQQVTVEGSADAERRRDSTLAMTVVGRDELDQYGDTGLLDVLQRQAGITIDGETPRLRGMGPGYTQILINGEPAPPDFSLDSLAPGDVERIEIVKGPSAEFGGVAGTINVILRAAPRSRQREARASVGFRTVSPQGSAALNWGDREGALGWFLPFSAYSWVNGGDLRQFRVSRLSTGEVRQQRLLGEDAWRGGGVNFGPRLDWRPNQQDTLQWSSFFQRNESDNRSSRHHELLAGPAITTVDEATLSRGSWLLARTQLQWTRRGEGGARLELRASAQGTLSRSASSYEGLDAAGARTLQRDSLASNREAQMASAGRWRQPLAQGHALVAGYDLSRRDRRELRRQADNGVELFSGTIGMPFFASIARATLFVQDEWTPDERWTVLAGLRAERADTVTAGPGQRVPNRHEELSPIVQVRHALDAKGRSLLRGGLARSVRVPDLGLLMPRYSFNGSYGREQTNTPIAADSAGNPRLQAETATALDFAWETHLPGGGVLSIGGFHREIRNLIRRRIALETVPEAPVPRWVSRPDNFGSARSSGLEFELKGGARQLLGAAGWAEAGAVAPAGLQLRAALSLFRSRVEQIDDPEARLEGQAPWTAQLGFDRREPGAVLGYGANLALTPGFATRQTDRQRVWRGAVQRLDAYALWRFSRELQLRVAAQNLLRTPQRNRSELQDVDGFVTGSDSWRQGFAQLTANLVWRF